jgi:acylphosphatase
VQGVWYRASAKDKAISLGIKGKVWNERNGDVGIIAQGSQAQIDEFIAWCKKGPPLARVEEVKEERIEINDIFQSFEITRE